MRERLRRAVPMMGLLLLVAGCDDRKEMADLGALTDSLRVTLPMVSDDLAATCERQNRLLDEIPMNERSGAERPQDCRAFQQVAERVAQDQSVLLAYLGAVGQLSSGGHAAFDAKLAANQTALGGYVGLPGTVVAASTAAQEILGKLTDLTTRHYRRKQVAAIVQSADPAVQQLTKALGQVVATDYRLMLGSEQNFLANYYEGPIAARKDERLTLILVQRQYDTDQDVLRQRVAAGAAYGEVMSSLAEMHRRLAGMGTHAASKVDAAAVRASIAAFRSDAAHLAGIERR